MNEMYLLCGRECVMVRQGLYLYIYKNKSIIDDFIRDIIVPVESVHSLLQSMNLTQ